MRHPISSSLSPLPAAKKSHTRKPTPCCAKVGLNRGPWTPEEDRMLSNYITKEGVGRWRTLPNRAGLLRCGKSCRLRWMNYLRPSIKRGHIGSDEEDIIVRLHRLLGSRWSLIAGRIPGRTDNEIKNYWNTHLSKKLISQGLDPRTHKPLDPNDSPSNSKPSSSSKPNQSRNSNPKFTAPTSFNGPIISTQFHEDYAMHYNEEENMIHYQGLSLPISDGIWNEEKDEDDYINYCTDDVFSSFLNSLINEDVVNNNHNQMPHEQMITGNNIVPHDVSNSDALISLPKNSFAFGVGCVAPFMSDFNQNHDPKRCIDDQVDKC